MHVRATCHGTAAQDKTDKKEVDKLCSERKKLSLT